MNLGQNGCNSAFSTARNQNKAYLFDNRMEQQYKNQQLTLALKSKEELIEEVTTIAWKSDQAMLPTQKVKKIRALLPLIVASQEGKLQGENLPPQKGNTFLDYLEKQSISLQKKAAPIVKIVHFNPKTSPGKLIAAIDGFQKK